jgi:hypothetical protein
MRDATLKLPRQHNQRVEVRVRLYSQGENEAGLKPRPRKFFHVVRTPELRIRQRERMKRDSVHERNRRRSRIHFGRKSRASACQPASHSRIKAK